MTDIRLLDLAKGYDKTIYNVILSDSEGSRRDSSVARQMADSLRMTKKMTSIRLDKYLSQKFPQYSRAFLKQQINQGNILINDATKKPSYILKPGDKIDFKISAPEKSTLEPNCGIKLNIVYEDENIIVINKPAGISAHPSKPGQNDTIANALLAYFPPIAKVGDPSASSGQARLRPGIVHRLDKDTSGLMAVAKNQNAFNWLKEQFANRKVIKKYVALVCGNIKEKQGIISKPIGKTKDFRKRTTITLKDKKEALTHYEVLEMFHSVIPAPACHASQGVAGRQAGIQKQISVSQNRTLDPRFRGDDKNTYTLLKIEPKTGRTHQIRVHLASIGHAIAGDNLYGFKNQAPLPGLKRQFLHASYLKFLLPDGKMLELTSDLPDDLNLCLQNLKSSITNK